MHGKSLFAAACFVFASSAEAAQAPLEALGERWHEARRSAEASAVRALLAEDFRITFADGSAGGADALIAALREGSGGALRQGEPNVRDARVYDGAALIDGVYRYTAERKSKEWVRDKRQARRGIPIMKEKNVAEEVTSRMRYSEVWVRDAGAWKLASVQLTPAD